MEKETHNGLENKCPNTVCPELLCASPDGSNKYDSDEQYHCHFREVCLVREVPWRENPIGEIPSGCILKVDLMTDDQIKH